MTIHWLYLVFIVCNTCKRAVEHCWVKTYLWNPTDSEELYESNSIFVYIYPSKKKENTITGVTMLSPNRSDSLLVTSYSNAAMYGVKCSLVWLVRGQWHSTLMQPHSSTCGAEGKAGGVRSVRVSGGGWRVGGFHNILPELLPPPHPPLWAGWEGGPARRMPFSVWGRFSVAMVTEGRKTGDRERGRGDEVWELVDKEEWLKKGQGQLKKRDNNWQKVLKALGKKAKFEHDKWENLWAIKSSRAIIKWTLQWDRQLV